MSEFIRCYPDMIDPALCRELIDRFDADTRKKTGQVVGQGNPKRSTDLAIRGLPDWEPMCARLDPCVVTSLRRYRADVPNFQDVHRAMRDTGYQLQAYQPNSVDGFDWHADAIDRTSCERFLAMIAYLNTVAEGGETEFRAQKLAVSPRAGSILWFPPGFEYVHRGKTPVGASKYVVTLFLVYL